MSRIHRLVLLIGTTAALLAVLVGIPVALIYLVGWPFPSPLPTRTEFGDLVSGRTPIPVDYLIDALGLVMWIIWLQIAWAAALEMAAAARGGLARRARMLPGVQAGVARLVTGAAFLATSLAVRPVAAGPLVPVSVGLVDEGPMLGAAGGLSPGADASRTSSGTVRSATETQQPRATAYLTESGDTWWGIASEKLGAGTRWKELRAINLGRTMEDGTVISGSTDLLRPNWRLLLPASRVTPVSSDGTRVATVEPGDTIWGIAEEDLGTSSVGEVATHVDDIASLNASQLNGNADLIFPGQKLDLPPLVGRAESPPTEDTETAEEADWQEIDRSDPDTSGERTVTPSPAMDFGPRLPSPAEINVVPEPAVESEPEPELAMPAEPAEAPVAEEAAADKTSITPEPSSSEVGSIGRAPDQTPPTLAPPASEPEADPDSAPENRSLSPDPGIGGARAETEPNTEEEADGPMAPVLDLDTGGAVPAAPTTAVPSLETVGPGLIDPEAPAIVDDQASGEGPDGELTEEEVAAAALPGDDETLDTGESRAPVFVGLAALTLIGGYLYRARGRRRETSLRHRHPGRRPQPPKRKTRGLARRLSAAAQPEHPEFVNVGLRALGRQLQGTSHKQLPKISGVWVSHNRLVIALADDSPHGVAPPPFMEFADGSGWSLRRSDFDEAREIAVGANGPLPLLTTVGTTSALDLALTTNSRAPADAYGLSSALLFAVDIEAGRVISIKARDESSTLEALTMMALELASSETADQVEIVCVGFGHRLATFDRVTVVDEISEILDDLETITSRAVYASADASPFATRVGNGAADTWDPVVVFHADTADPYASTLVELAAKTEGGVTAVCGYEAGTGWTMHVDGEKVRCPDLPGDLSKHEFIRPKLDGVELVADLFDEPWSDVEIDEEFWSPMDDSTPDHTWYLPDDEESPWRPMSSVTDSDRRAVTDQQAEGAISTVDRWDLPPAPPSSTPPPPPAPVTPPSFASLGEHWNPDGPTSSSEVEPPAEFEPVPLRLVKNDDVETGDDVDVDAQATEPPEPDRSGPESWPGHDAPLLKDLRHSVELGPATTDQPADEPEPESELASEEPDNEPVDEDQVAAETTDERPEPATDHSDSGTAAQETAEPPEDLDQDVAAAERTVFVAPIARAKTVDNRDGEPAGGLEVSVLGDFTIDGRHIGDRSKPWKYTKTPELILYLLLHPGGASQDLLMEQLFPEQPPNRPRLNQLVSDARTKALGQNDDGDYHLPHASPTEPFYKLLPTISLDLRDFARHCARAKSADNLHREKAEWEAALKLVKGRPFTLPHDGYEWAVPEIEATIVKVEEAAMALADLALDIEDYHLAVWATKQGLLTGTGYSELLVKRGRAALLLQDPEEIVRAFADLQVSLDYSGAPEETTPDLSIHPELEEIYNELSSEGRGQDRP